MTTVALVALGAVIGAPLRYYVDKFIRTLHDTPFPWGTLTVNLAASLVLGLLSGAGHHAGTALIAFVGTGICGSLSTYSTFGYENQQLVRMGDRFHAVANMALSVLAGVGVAALGWSIGLTIA